jgi:phosphate-selective porin OprO and OprP
LTSSAGFRSAAKASAYKRAAVWWRPFSAGLADPNLWTNHTQMVDVGLNCQLNKSVKIYFDWEHAILGNPVVYKTTTGRKSSVSDLYWCRFQSYF